MVSISIFHLPIIAFADVTTCVKATDFVSKKPFPSQFFPCFIHVRLINVPKLIKTNVDDFNIAIHKISAIQYANSVMFNLFYLKCENSNVKLFHIKVTYLFSTSNSITRSCEILHFGNASDSPLFSRSLVLSLLWWSARQLLRSLRDAAGRLPPVSHVRIAASRRRPG